MSAQQKRAEDTKIQDCPECGQEEFAWVIKAYGMCGECKARVRLFGR